MLPRLALLPLLATRLWAQAVTGATVQGRVLAPDGSAIPSAAVTIRHDGTGERWTTTTGANGRFYLEHLTVGGPYRIEVRAIGWKPVVRSDQFLSLDQRKSADFVLEPATVELQPLVVRASADSGSVGSTRGPAEVIAESTIVRLPLLRRDVFDVALLSALVARSRTGGLSIAGQPDALNALRIDGVTVNDLLRGSSTAGAGLGARTVSLETIQALEVV